MSNSEKNFLERRRQPFLTEAYFKKFIEDETTIGLPHLLKKLEKPNKTALGKKSCLEGIANSYTTLLHLRYTAGESIEKLSTDMDEVVSAWEDYTKVLREFKEDPTWPAFWAAYRVDYTRMILLVGLTVLLQRQDLLPRIDALIHTYRGNDTLLDELMNASVLPKIEADEYAWFHDDPYETVIDAIDSTNTYDQVRLMGQAVLDWYPANEGEPFHDSHKDVSDEGEGGYCGYWCFELAALCVIKNIDDSSFRNHITYPKDLVDFARQVQAQKQAALIKLAPVEGEVPSAMPGQPCPKAGRWLAPHLRSKVVVMQVGEKMPGLNEPLVTGEVIWYWIGI